MVQCCMRLCRDGEIKLVNYTAYCILEVRSALRAPTSIANFIFVASQQCLSRGVCASLLAVKAKGDSNNKKGVAIEDKDPVAKFPHKVIWMGLHQNITAGLFRNLKTACRTLLHLK